MTTKANRIIVGDLEATCWEDGIPPAGQKQEIIEVGLCVIELRDKQIRHRNNWLIKPKQSKVSKFCEDLTGISQEMLDTKGHSFEFVMEEIRRLYGRSTPWLSWGAWDRVFWEQVCRELGLEFPLSQTHYNGKHLYSMLSGGGKTMGLQRALCQERLEFEGGQPHRAGPDSYNTGRIILNVL